MFQYASDVVGSDIQQKIVKKNPHVITAGEGMKPRNVMTGQKNVLTVIE